MIIVSNNLKTRSYNFKERKRGNVLGDCPGHRVLMTGKSPGLTKGWKKTRGHAMGTTGAMSQDRKSLANAPVL